LAHLHGMQIVFGGDFVDRLDSPRGLQSHSGLEIRGKVPSVVLPFHGSRSKSAENAPTLKPQIQSSPWLRPLGPPLDTRHYNLSAIIAVGYKVNSERAVQFRKWATGVIESFTIRGFAMDDERLKNDGSILGKKYFEEQLQRIREIRLSERRFYQKITDIYATSIDYDITAAATKRFFATVQNNLHWAIHGQTAAEVIVSRADASQDCMGLTTWKDAPEGKIQKFDVSVAKNYLTEAEMAQLQRLVSAYLDVAEDMALRQIPMTMEDWETRLNRFIAATDREILQDAGKVTAEIAQAHAESEFEKYRIVQDRLFESDFDRLVGELTEALESGEM
jgi:hypothetical protein